METESTCLRQERSQPGKRGEVGSCGEVEKGGPGSRRGEKTRGEKTLFGGWSNPRPISSFRAKRSGDPEPSGAREREAVGSAGFWSSLRPPVFDASRRPSGRRRRGAAGFRVCEPLRVSPPGMTIAEGGYSTVSAPPSTRTNCARPRNGANSSASVPVMKACRPRASISSNRAALRAVSRWAGASSRRRTGGAL
jgi:hypothetical protein